MRLNGRPSRFMLLMVMLFLCGVLVALSIAGILTPVESIVASPLNDLSGALNRFSVSFNQSLDELNSLGQLRDRIGELEEQLALRQIELIQLREAASDYDRLVNLLSYTTTLENQEFLTSDVIGIDQTGIARSITINRGTRDGVVVGMPVTTDLGLVGRIIRVSANAAQVQLIIDENSAVSARLQDDARGRQYYRPGVRRIANDIYCAG